MPGSVAETSEMQAHSAPAVKYTLTKVNISKQKISLRDRTNCKLISQNVA